MHFSQGVITIPPRQALCLVVIAEGLVVEEGEEVVEEVDDDGVKPMRWWVMVFDVLSSSFSLVLIWYWCKKGKLLIVKKSELPP